MKYIENDDFVCGFFNDEFEKPFLVDGITKMIRPNRIAIALDTSSNGIHDLLLQDQVKSFNIKITPNYIFKPLNILPGSLLHPATKDKTTGKLWPLYDNHRNLLLNVLPYLIKVYHCIAYFNNSNHENGVFGQIIDEFIQNMVRISSNNLKL